MHPLPLAALKIFSLNLVFRSLIRVWIKVGFFALILFEDHIACWTCRFILFIKLETLSAIMFPNAFQYYSFSFYKAWWSGSSKLAGLFSFFCIDSPLKVFATIINNWLKMEYVQLILQCILIFLHILNMHWRTHAPMETQVSPDNRW